MIDQGISSLLYATDQQFIERYHLSNPIQYSQSEFTEECKNKQCQAQEDFLILKNKNTTYEAISEKLNRIINKARESYRNCQNKALTQSDSSLITRCIVEVIDDKSLFRVYGLDCSTWQREECDLCDEIKTQYSFEYRIENKLTEAGFRINQLSFHALEKHHYCGKKANKNRLDLLTICAVLNIPLSN